MPSGSLSPTCENHTGNSNCVTAVAHSTRYAGRCIRLDRYTRHTAARPTSQIMYWGLITRLVAVNSSTATKAASAVVDVVRRRARSRHTSSQTNAAAVSTIATVDTARTPGPRNSIEP
ncbi:hypothetical protein GCM10017752_50780 [Streptomyces roseoviridis]